MTLVGGQMAMQVESLKASNASQAMGAIRAQKSVGEQLVELIYDTVAVLSKQPRPVAWPQSPAQIRRQRLVLRVMGNRPTRTYLVDMKAIRTLLDGADYIGIKTIEAENDLEGFLRRIFAYRPRLVRLLYRLRAPLVRLLGFRQDPLPAMPEWIPEEFPMLPCGNVWLFTVREVRPDRYWIAGCPRDRHLDADMAVVAEPLAGGRRRFHILTVVRYKHWTGPIYFNLIRIFNLLLIDRMARSAAPSGNS